MEGTGRFQLGGKKPDTTELYRRGEDYKEEEDVSHRHPETAEKLELELRRFVSSLSFT